MNFNKVNNNNIDSFTELLGFESVVIDTELLTKYGSDETEDLSFPPDVVLKPTTPDQIARILKHCNNHQIPVTVRGGGTGLAGGALPVYGGVVISMEKFNQIIEIDEKNLQVTVEPGVITEVLQNKLKELGLYYPPDPSSKGISFIGGNVSTNAGGPRAVKYGVVKDYVLNLEMVLPNGEIIWTGANTLKNSTGYNLTQLVVGSEGTLGVVTKIVLKLIPYPNYNFLMLAPFNHIEEACKAVSAIFQGGITPSALEFMEREAIVWALNYVGDSSVKIDDNTQAHLLIEVDGNHIEALQEDCMKIAEILSNFNCGEILFADNETQKNELWKLRRNVAHAVKLNSVYKEEDTVVPRASLPVLIKGIKELEIKYGFKSVCYGHAGDGNLHVNILKSGLSDEKWNTELPIAIRELFTLVKSLNGTISGEHGIGWVQKSYMDIVFSETSLSLMKNIKKVFDPNSILNPGKIF